MLVTHKVNVHDNYSFNGLLVLLTDNFLQHNVVSIIIGKCS